MKKNLIASFLMLFAVTSLLVTSCKKEETKPNNQNSNASSFTAKVDGADWTSSTTGATFRNDVLVVSGKSSTGATIILRVQVLNGMETIAPYPMYYGSSSNVGVFMESSSDSLAYATNQFSGRQSEGSKLTLTKFDKASKKVSGTFTLKVQRMLDNKLKTITGTFTDVTYDDQIPPTPNKTMTAKVNGTAWTATSVMGIYSSMTSSVLITGNASNGTSIGLNIPISASKGDKLTPSAFGNVRAQYNPSSSTFKGSDEGTITITEHDKDLKVMKGTFSFVAEDMEQSTPEDVITEGSFVVTY